jgi:hypothetical protein
MTELLLNPQNFKRTYSTYMFSSLFILVFKFAPMIMITFIAGMLFIWEVAGLNLGLETSYPVLYKEPTRCTIVQ